IHTIARGGGPPFIERRPAAVVVRLEPEAEAQAEIGQAVVMRGQAGVGDVIEKDRDIGLAHDPVTDIQSFAEQHARAQFLTRTVGFGQRTVMNRAAETQVYEEVGVARKDSLTPEDAPGEAAIELIGVAAGVDAEADMRPRCEG